MQTNFQESMYDNEQFLLERERELTKVYEDVVEVHKLTRAVAELVTQQGSLVDNIQSNIEHSHTHVTKGLKEVEKAEESQKSSIVGYIVAGVSVSITAIGATIAAVVLL